MLPASERNHVLSCCLAAAIVFKLRDDVSRHALYRAERVHQGLRTAIPQVDVVTRPITRVEVERLTHDERHGLGLSFPNRDWGNSATAYVLEQAMRQLVYEAPKLFGRLQVESNRNVSPSVQPLVPNGSGS